MVNNTHKQANNHISPVNGSNASDVRQTGKKKLLFVVEALGGGVFTYIVDLANELVQQHDVYIAYALRPQTPADYKDYFDKRIHLTQVKHFVRSIDPANDFKAMLELKKIARSIRPDVIHLHSSKAGVLGRLVFSGKKPLFYTPHGYSFLMADQSPLKRAIYKAIEAICAKRKCTTISCSAGEHQETLKLTSRALYVNNGINTAELDALLAEASGVSTPGYTVFTLGRICHQKNPALFNQIALAMPATKFLWIGDGELRSALTAPNITVSGWVKRAEALKLCRSVPVFLLTSLWEGLPLSLLEAMYLRKLCVVSDVIGNHDVIRSGENGFVCRSVEEYVHAIATANAQPLIEQARQDVQQCYNTVVMAQQYSKIYADALVACGEETI